MSRISYDPRAAAKNAATAQRAMFVSAYTQESAARRAKAGRYMAALCGLAFGLAYVAADMALRFIGA